MKQFAVIGNPIEHSLSPQIHTEFAKQCNVSISYIKLTATTKTFKKIVNNFFTNGGHGMNVTLPFKHMAFDLVDDITDEASIQSQSINTLVKCTDTNKLKGYNTDGKGLVNDLTSTFINLSNVKILILGTGGASSAIIPELYRATNTAIHVWGRDPTKAAILAHRHQECIAIPTISHFSNYDLIINAISLEANLDIFAQYTSTHSYYYDLSYSNTQDTNFIAMVKKTGATKYCDGKGMLIAQAAHSFNIWNGMLPDITHIKI